MNQSKTVMALAAAALVASLSLTAEAAPKADVVAATGAPQGFDYTAPDARPVPPRPGYGYGPGMNRHHDWGWRGYGHNHHGGYYGCPWYNEGPMVIQGRGGPQVSLPAPMPLEDILAMDSKYAEQVKEIDELRDLIFVESQALDAMVNNQRNTAEDVRRQARIVTSLRHQLDDRIADLYAALEDDGYQLPARLPRR